MLYLETGALPIRFVIISRRLLYLKHILSLNEHELVHRVYQAQKRKPTKNDWVLSIEDDKNLINLNLTDIQIQDISDQKFKILIKDKIRKAAFQYLFNLKESHSKVSMIEYKKYKIQDYLCNSNFKMEEKQLLFKLRSKMLNCKENFRSMYISDQCDICMSGATQTQRHLLEDCQPIISACDDITENVVVEHDDIYGTVDQQLKVVRLYAKVLSTREKLEADSPD